MKQHEVVVLNRRIPESGLEAGDVGTIVHVYPGDHYEVEFVAGDGETVAVLTLDRSDVREVAEHEILHVRRIPA